MITEEAFWERCLLLKPLCWNKRRCVVAGKQKTEVKVYRKLENGVAMAGR